MLHLVQLEEPLTKKVWKLEDFEGYPALLVFEVTNPWLMFLLPRFETSLTNVSS